MTRNEYASYLNGIELGARMAARNARLLPSRPVFQTNAEAELAAAREAITNALEQVVCAQAAYRMKPVDA